MLLFTVYYICFCTLVPTCFLHNMILSCIIVDLFLLWGKHFPDLNSRGCLYEHLLFLDPKFKNALTLLHKMSPQAQVSRSNFFILRTAVVFESLCLSIWFCREIFYCNLVYGTRQHIITIIIIKLNNNQTSTYKLNVTDSHTRLIQTI